MTHGKRLQKIKVTKDGWDMSITGNIKGTLSIRYEDQEGENSEIVQVVQQQQQQQPKVMSSPPIAHQCNEHCTTTGKVPIEFENPLVLLQREKKSKRLDANSLLVQYLSCIRSKILTRFPNAKGNDRPWHIELCSKFIDEATMVRKALSLRGNLVDVKDISNYSFMGKDDRAFVLATGPVEDYGETHITIAFFVNALTPEDREWCKSLVV